MKIAIINGTNRIGNRTLDITKATAAIAQKVGFKVSIVTLDNFTELFRGEKISLENTKNKGQKIDIQNMINANALIFVIPTYHSGIPGSLKNFFDSIKENKIYDHTVIGVISSNDSNRDYGARQAVQVLNGILAFNKLKSFVVPIIPIINFDNIDSERIKKFLLYCEDLLIKKS